VSGPKYDLNDVKAAARCLNIEYRGRIVQRDINNLGYELADVAQCVMQLSVHDHRKSIRYEDCPTDDVYMCTFTRAGNEESDPDDLYIKFCLVDGCLSIDLGSFHLRRF
jgi:hypothetical protein